VAVDFGLQLFFQSPAHPLPAFGFHVQLHLPQRAGCVCVRAHRVPFVVLVSVARRGTADAANYGAGVKLRPERSSAEPTKKSAKTPTRFFYISQPKSDYIPIPEVSSERREYIPIGFVSKNVISANTNFLIASNSLYHFGVLTSAMHMAWMRQIGGRLESRYRYSGSMVYDNYPWPADATKEQHDAVEFAAQKVLTAREEYPDCTLAQLYDPLKMPQPLRKAHDGLDRAVDRCYRKETFTSERQRVEFLFALYEKLTAPLVAAAKPQRVKKGKGFYSQKPPPIPPGESTAESEAAAAHFYFMAKEEPSPQEKQ